MHGPLDDDFGWSHLAAGVTIYEVEGAHHDLHLAPHVHSLAAVLGTYLAPEG
jgi:thioesterase domain-containing protein